MSSQNVLNLAALSFILSFLLPYTVFSHGVSNQPAHELESSSRPIQSVIPATSHTAEKNKQVAEELPLGYQRDFKFARKGLIAQLEGSKIETPSGRLVVDATLYDFVEGDAPPEVNPSLWRHSKLSRMHGLFKVVDGVYQFRGYDLAVMTLIEGKTGWIIVDPLFTAASSSAGLALANEHLGERPVSAVIFTHSHQDHFGGINGVLPESKEDASKIEIIAPLNFFAETLSEHHLAGPHMNGRIRYQGGLPLKDGPNGRMGLGLGQVVALGPIVAKPATIELGEGTTRMEVDGIEIIFEDASGTEATSEFVFYFPEFKVLHTAEVVSGTLHNVLTPRGAQVRDTLKWSQVIDKILANYGGEAEALIASHHHPFFGNEAVKNKLRNHRNVYRYLHDQTLRLANQGRSMHEIANAIPEPQLMKGDFSVRGYYGNFKHNIRAVYQLYYGWWGGNPGTMNPLDPKKAGNHYVEFMGGEEELLDKAKKSYEKGEYRWLAMVLNHLVFANPENQEARNLLADAYTQLGYQEESAIFRNIYLTGALELRNGRAPGFLHVEKEDLPPLQDFGNLAATRFNPQKFKHQPFIVEFELEDNQSLSFDVGEDVLFPRVGSMDEVTYTIKTSYKDMNQWFLGKLDSEDMSSSEELVKALDALQNSLEDFVNSYNIIEP